jgi:hypothetical protein
MNKGHMHTSLLQKVTQMITFLAIFAEIQEQKETQLGATQQIPTQDGNTVPFLTSQLLDLMFQPPKQEISKQTSALVKEN